MSDLSQSFSALSPNAKAMFLARVAHHATVGAREAYIADHKSPDGIRLLAANEFVHRVTGYTMHVLDSTEMEGQDASVMEMIEYHFNLGSKNLVYWL